MLNEANCSFFQNLELCHNIQTNIQQTEVNLEFFSCHSPDACSFSWLEMSRALQQFFDFLIFFHAVILQTFSRLSPDIFLVILMNRFSFSYNNVWASRAVSMYCCFSNCEHSTESSLINFAKFELFSSTYIHQSLLMMSQGYDCGHHFTEILQTFSIFKANLKSDWLKASHHCI